MSTTAKDAIAVIITRLQAIATGSGYNTDAGSQVFSGVRYFSDDETFPIVTVFTGDEITEKIMARAYRSERSVNIECFVQDNATPTVSIEELIEDIQRALEQADHTLGGLVHQLDYTGISEIDPPEAGSDISGVRITYAFEYDRNYGD